MKNYQNLKFFSMPQEQKDVVQAGVEAWYHFCYQNRNKDGRFNKYAQYANDGKSLDQKQELFTKGLQEEALRYAGIPSDTKFSEGMIQSHPAVQWATFAIVAQTLDIIVPETVLDSFYEFAEVKNVNWGDQLLFHVESPDMFAVSTKANGIRGSQRQRLFGKDVTLTPVRRTVEIYEELYRVLAGKTNWGNWVARVAQAIETDITSRIYDSIYNSFPSLSASYKETAAFTQTAFNNLVSRVAAANNNKNTVAFGTKVALSKVLPENQYMQFALGGEYNKNGHLGNFQGTQLFEMEQKLKPNTDDFTLASDFILVVSSGSDKIVKIGFEGNTEVLQSKPEDNADRSVGYSVAQHYDVQLITSAQYGIYKLT
ncbi:hypothetical protein NV379_02610 [Paenibacillus sp. N1-5-1-14]|uniref:hypothetical protein n=1 Tax=Paenibacillus radicibacter TaxID=2972488 RepID=UPI0021599327|nr:hypothetical protein [Paenibacillus radicibacter]MCR8641538.1 hypothetical protein [Paenibacillus radicibacter]